VLKSAQVLLRVFYNIFFPFLSSFYFKKTKVYIPRRCLLFKRWLETGDYEQENILIFSKLFKQNSNIFDIGANIGLVSISLLDLCPSSSVVSFEPSPGTAFLLRKTAQKSKYKHRWNIIPKALGNRIGKAEFFSAPIEMGVFDGFANTGRAGAMDKISVEATTLDNEWEKLGTPIVSLIKIDVEGAELQVLGGGNECIIHERPAILIEWNSNNFIAYSCKIENILEWANSSKYRLFSMPALIPISNQLELKVASLTSINFLLLPENI
jgi:FkbM family methyltransferase